MSGRARRGGGRVGLTALLVAAVVTVAAAVSAAPGASPAAADEPEVAPPDKRVLMVADSVGLGAADALPAAFPADWQVLVRGTPAMFVEQLQATYVDGGDPSWFGDFGVVAGGYNYPYWDPDRFDRSIDGIIEAFERRGVEHVFWVTLREVDPQYITAGAWNQVQPYYWYFPTVNDHLERALDRHPNLTLIDWAGAANRPGITYDAIHLNTAGAALYSSLVRHEVDIAAQRVPAGSVTRVPIPDAAGLAAVSLNLTTTHPRTSGFLTAFACGGPTPVVSNHNHLRGETVAHAALVPVGDDGSVCVFTETATNLVVDITGRFPSGAGLLAVAPRRLADTRTPDPAVRHPGGTPLQVKVAGIDGVPGDVAAVAVNVTAVGAAGPGFVTVGPCGGPTPATSNVNFGADAATPNLVVVEPGVGGEICVLADRDTNLIVDLFAAFEAGADVGLITPERRFDSRVAGVPVGAGSTTAVRVSGGAIPDGANGVLLNLTAAGPAGDGFLTVYPCAAGVPIASNLNTAAGRDVANFVAVQPDASGDVCVYSSVATHVIVDLLGWTGTAFVGQTPGRLLDTRSPV